MRSIKHNATSGRSLRLFLVVLLCANVCVALFSGQTDAANATSGNCHPHCYSEGDFNAPRLQEITGVFGQWHDNAMSPTSSACSQPDVNHINSEMWFILDDYSYIETGLYDGCEYFAACLCWAYGQFWADTTSDDRQVSHLIRNLTPDGTNHAYQISRAPQRNQWLIIIDGQTMGLSTVLSRWSGQTHQAGGELSSEAGYSYANTFDMYLNYEDVNGAIGSYGSPSKTRVSPYFNAQTYGGGEWSWNLS